MDITQFHATFFEESREGLAAMESGLLALESGRADGEAIHTVFRAAHSIKGGAATFGFNTITDLTHLLETLLDAARAGRHTLDAAAIEVLLTAVDVLRALLDVEQHGGVADDGAVAGLRMRLQQILQAPAAASAPVAAATPAAAAATVPMQSDWRIDFTPEPSLYLSGNDPLRILRELERLGELGVACRSDALPAFAALDPANAYLAWRLTLPASVARADIDEAFAWVEDDCTLVIEAVGAPVAAVAARAPVVHDDSAPASAAAAHGAHGDGAAESSIRVGTGKVDALINLVGELVITQAMLRQHSGALDPIANEALLAGLAQLERNTRDLQDTVMGVRMLPVEAVFSRFPRLIRDLSTRLQKKVRLVTRGEGTELDKGMIEKLADPLVHLVRNAIDHGLETPADRLAAGKSETGTVTLSASHQSGNIVIEVSDDGRGLDRARILRKAIERGIAIGEDAGDTQVWELIFHPGFSTAEQVTDVSGRGVGMDVVKQNIIALGGQVEIASRPGNGTTVVIRLPLTLAILDGMLVAVGAETFIVPLNAVVESLLPAADDIRSVGGHDCMLRVRDSYMPLLSLHSRFGVPRPAIADGAATPPMAVVVDAGGRTFALQVDELLGQQQIVVKSIESHYRRVAGISGATILGDGHVALIVDAGALSQSLAQSAPTPPPGQPSSGMYRVA